MAVLYSSISISLFHWRKALVISINKNLYSTDIWVLLVLLVYGFLLRK